MTSVALPRPGQLALVAAWPTRGESARQIAQRLATFLPAINDQDTSLGEWRRGTGRSKATAAANDVDQLADFVERAAVKDSSQPPKPIVGAGYRLALANAGSRFVAVKVTDGEAMPTATSSCLLSIEDGLPALRTRAAAAALLHAAIDAFDPAWATWTSAALTGLDYRTPAEPAVGYLNYGPRERMLPLDENAYDYANGAVATIGDDPEVRDEELIRRSVAIVRGQ